MSAFEAPNELRDYTAIKLYNSQRNRSSSVVDDIDDSRHIEIEARGSSKHVAVTPRKVKVIIKHNKRANGIHLLEKLEPSKSMPTMRRKHKLLLTSGELQLQ